MKLPTYQFVAQMGAAFAVVVSLGFVAYELKLTRDTAKADVYQQSAAMTMEYQASKLSNERLQDAFEKGREDPSQLSKRELYLILDYFDGWMWQKEAQFYQHQIGMSDETEWETHQKSIMLIGEYPCYRQSWSRGGQDMVRTDFAVEVNRIWADAPEPECQFSGWK